MADIKNIDIRKGMVFVGSDGTLYECLDRDLNTPGNWRAILYLKVRNLKTGSITDNRVKPDDKVALAYLDTRDMQYSYRDGDNFVFMDAESFEQMELNAKLIGEKMAYIRENDKVRVTMYEGKPLRVELPQTVELTVTEAEPEIKGATAQAQLKNAVVETGLTVKVPAFISAGDVIKIDTETGECLGRVAK